MGNQVWHVHPEGLAVRVGCCGGVTMWAGNMYFIILSNVMIDPSKLKSTHRQQSTSYLCIYYTEVRTIAVQRLQTDTECYTTTTTALMHFTHESAE